MPHPRVPRDLVGYVDSPASPAADPAHLGAVTLHPTAPQRARSHVTLTLRYTVGRHGVDDRGGMKILMRFPADGGDWQFTDPTAANFVTVTSAARCDFQCVYEAFGDARPWFRVLRIRVVGGCIRQGEVVTITLGDGGPGLRLQTFCEHAWELRFLVDACATGHFVELPDRLSIPIVPGAVARYLAVLPTRWTVGTPLWLGLRGEDSHGNPAAAVDGPLHLSASLPVDGLPQTVDWRGQRALRVEGLTARRAGVLTITLHSADGSALARSNPVVVQPAGPRSFWGDLHGQSGETVGINSAAQYFAFARDLAFLDITSHQGNAFQINNRMWDHLNALTARFNAPGRFLTLPGYEWSGNTAVGGDRNVYFRREGRPIRRSSHALLTDRQDIDTDCITAEALFAALQDEDAFAYAHVGGRYADIALAHDGRIERSVEIHSAWGTFTWLLYDAFDLGYRVGVVANSDGHKGRPGASHPGAATFGAYGGLTCFLLDTLTRDALVDCVRARRHYATSGARMDLDVSVSLAHAAALHSDDPALGPTTTTAATTATMGQILSTDEEAATVRFAVTAGAPVVSVEVRCGRDTVRTFRPDAPLGARARLLWQGARYRGRGRKVVWDGALQLHAATLTAIGRINAFNPDHTLSHTATSARWQAVTTGNFGGLDLWLEETAGARISVRTGPLSVDVPLADIGREDLIFPAGGLDMALRLVRMPAQAPCHLSGTCTVPLAAGDNPVWVCVTTEDGHQAWSSPTYLIKSTDPLEAAR